MAESTLYWEMDLIHTVISTISLILDKPPDVSGSKFLKCTVITLQCCCNVYHITIIRTQTLLLKSSHIEAVTLTMQLISIW